MVLPTRIRRLALIAAGLPGPAPLPHPGNGPAGTSAAEHFGPGRAPARCGWQLVVVDCFRTGTPVFKDNVWYHIVRPVAATSRAYTSTGQDPARGVRHC